METKIYSSMSSAKRGAMRAGMKTPKFTKLVDGRVEVTETAKARKSDNGPVAIFRAIFKAEFGKLRRSEVIAKAIEAGISKNTAATYYQKLKATA